MKLQISFEIFIIICIHKIFILYKIHDIQLELRLTDIKNPAYGRQSISRPMRIVAPMPQEGGPRIPKNPIFFQKRKKSSKTKNSKNVQKYAKISNTPFDQRSLIHRKALFPGGPRIPKICHNQQYALRREVSNPSGSGVCTMFCKAKSAKKKKKNFLARQFQTTSKKKCSNVRPPLSITFPQEFRISKNI